MPCVLQRPARALCSWLWMLGLPARTDPSLHRNRAAAGVGDVDPGLLGNDDAGCDVPGLQAFFPEPVIPARADVAEVQGGSTPCGADPCVWRMTWPIWAMKTLLVPRLLAAGAAMGDQAVGEAFTLAAAQTALVDPGAFTAFGPEQLVAQGVEHDSRS